MIFNEWKTVKVGETIISSNTGLDAIKRAPIVDYNSGIKCLRIQDISQNKNFEDWGYCLVEEKNFKKFQLVKGDIIVARTGATIGVNRLIKQNLKAVYNNGLIRIKSNADIINTDYLYYNLQSHKYKGHIQAISGGTSTQPNMKMNALLDYEIKLPSLNEQKSIAHILSTLDDKIEVNNQINRTLENMAQAIFKQWFVDFEFPNEDGEPYKSSGGEMVESELGMIPKGWEVGNLAESKLTNLVKTGIDEFSGEKIYLATADVDKSDILSNTTKVTYNERPSRANMQPKENTVWFAKMKDSRKLIRVSRGSKDLIENYIFSTGFAGINVKEGLNYIWSFICSNDFDIRKNNLCHGTTMQAINNSNISNIPLLLPKEEMIQIFEGVTNYLYESEYLRKKENEKLAEIRDSLLPKLMSGEIRVPLDAEDDAS